MTKEEFRKEANINARQDFLEVLLFYFYEHRTELTPNTMAKIFIEEYSKIAVELAKEMNEDDDDYIIPTKKDSANQIEKIIITLGERKENEN